MCPAGSTATILIKVEIAIPEGGLGTLLNAMHDFCRSDDFLT